MRSPQAKVIEMTVPRRRIDLRAVFAFREREIAPRRDPYAMWRASRGALPEEFGPIPHAATLVDSSRSSQSQLPLRKVEHPQRIVLAVVALVTEELETVDREVLGAARMLADPGGAVYAMSAATSAALAAGGADRHIKAARAADQFDADAWTARVLSVMEELAPACVVFPGTAREEDLALRVAARCETYPATQICQISPAGIVRLDRTGRIEFRGHAKGILTIAPGMFEPVDAALYEARPAHVRDSSVPASRVTDLGAVALDPMSVPLEEAAVILSAGNGVQDWNRFFAVAQLLGAAPAGTRVVCDAGHLPRDRQVGASGRIVSADCYIALGISGATQHLQGIESCKQVFAVNRDPHAPIFKRADRAIVGDADAVVAACLERLRRCKA